MAFDRKDDRIKEALGEPISSPTYTLPTGRDSSFEKKKNYTFTLKPSIREKLDTVARERGFRSSAAFLEALIEGLSSEND